MLKLHFYTSAFPEESWWLTVSSKYSAYVWVGCINILVWAQRVGEARLAPLLSLTWIDTILAWRGWQTDC